MKIVNLKAPAVIAGAVRYPIEVALTVSDDEAVRLKASDRLDGEAEDIRDDGDGLEKKKVDDLKQIAIDEKIDLGEAKFKPEIIAKIRAARADD